LAFQEPDSSALVDELWAWDSAVDSWAELTGSGIARTRSCAAVIDGEMYLYGGSGVFAAALNNLWKIS